MCQPKTDRPRPRPCGRARYTLGMARQSTRRRGLAVVGASALLIGLGVGLLLSVGCEEQSSTPPSSGLSQNPTSLPGRSAKTAKDIAQQAENRDAQAGAMADELSGQAGKYELAGLVFSVPTSWNQGQAASEFVAQEYKVPGDDGDARVTFSHFKQGGGTIDQNVARWESQFTDGAGGSVVAYPVKRTVAGCNVTLVKIDGTMKGGTPGGPTTDVPNSGLRGALIEGPQGLVVVKMTGPKGTLDGAEAEWDRLIQGMTKKGR